ncbi:hypothetical protein C2869_12265 [Saccharobesus litoralis]|uniref:Uncharacterized protein n=1 Tax=Saccharobesus litoralis TaxID=2172099 RepID=A0A2S0VSK6_9ALTE|nr:hypothetical protein [Saccharobesus litoralis]AWB67162.1 hypothetical protein C2869_12265 [Saccharobesus litoralis]
MKIFKVGDSQKAICESCQSIENTTFQLRDVPFSDESGTVKNVLVGVCDKCDEVVIIPQQSAPMINKQLCALRKPIESKVPAHFIDMLNNACAELGAKPDFSNALIKYYVHMLSNEAMPADKLKTYLKSNLAAGKSDKRISLKSSILRDEITTLRSKAHIKSTSGVIKAVVLKIHDDIQVHPQPNLINQLKGVVAAVS